MKGIHMKASLYASITAIVFLSLSAGYCSEIRGKSEKAPKIAAQRPIVKNSNRHLTPDVIEDVEFYLPKEKHKVIKVSAVANDQEAFDFALEIKEYLESKGWKVVGINHDMEIAPINGQMIRLTGSAALEIIIGPKE